MIFKGLDFSDFIEVMAKFKEDGIIAKIYIEENKDYDVKVDRLSPKIILYVIPGDLTCFNKDMNVEAGYSKVEDILLNIVSYQLTFLVDNLETRTVKLIDFNKITYNMEELV